MTKKCFLCSTKYTRSGSTSFHRFPKIPKIRDTWIENLKIGPDKVAKIDKNTRICSKHFRADDLVLHTLGKMNLMGGAIPIPWVSPTGPSSEDKESLQTSLPLTDFSKMQKIEVIYLYDKSPSPKRKNEDTIQTHNDSVETQSNQSMEEIYLTNDESPSPKRKNEATVQSPTDCGETQNNQSIEEIYLTNESPSPKRSKISNPHIDLAMSETDDGSENISSCSSDADTAPQTIQYLNKKFVKVPKIRERKSNFRDITLEDLKNPKTLEPCWKVINERVAVLEKKVRALQQNSRRLQAKISCQESLINYLTGKSYLNESG